MILYYHLFSVVPTAVAFSSPRNYNPHRIGNRIQGSNNNRGGSKPPPPPRPPKTPLFSSFFDESDDDNHDGEKYWSHGHAGVLAVSSLLSQDEPNKSTLDEELSLHQNDTLCMDYDLSNENISEHTCTVPDIRGGSQATKKKTDEALIAGSKSTLSSTIEYWSDAARDFPNRLSKIFKRGTNEDPDENEIDPTSITIETVSVPQSSLLPQSVVKAAAQRSGLLGSTLSSDRVQECARALKRWYAQHGYVLHSVTGATLHTDNSTATLSVQEPKLSTKPVSITFAKEVYVDPDTGEETTLRKYREKFESSSVAVKTQEQWQEAVDKLNATLVQSKGRTNPTTLSKRLQLHAGKHFRWYPQLWQNIAQSGVFSKVYSAAPIRLNDGTVQLQVLVAEPPARNLEYGVSKNLYTGTWEGELDLKHGNVLGGGETLGVVVRRAAKDAEPSMRLRFTDDKFGLPGGYETEIFNDYIAVKKKEKKKSKGSSDDVEESIDDDEDSLLSRKGVSYSQRNPISINIVENSSAKVSLERTATRAGEYESIGSLTVNLGPIRKNLPLGAKTDVSTRLTTGTRLGSNGAATLVSSSSLSDSDLTQEVTTSTSSSWQLFPYSSATATTRQEFPILTGTYSTPNERTSSLALQHSIMSSTKNLPRHEANAAGFAARVRGYSSTSNSPVCSSLTGSAEVRIPVTIPFSKDRLVQDCNLVVFGDWMYGLKQSSSDGSGGVRRAFNDWKNTSFRKSSVGLGVRKTIQGIPIKYDFSLTEEGKLGAFFGLGHDWNV